MHSNFIYAIQFGQPSFDGTKVSIGCPYHHCLNLFVPGAAPDVLSTATLNPSSKSCQYGLTIMNDTPAFPAVK